MDFANYVSKLLVKTCDNDIDQALKKTRTLYDHLHENIRNFYEQIDSIPLFWLYELQTLGKDNWDYTQKEYDAEVNKARKKCIKLYTKD